MIADAVRRGAYLNPTLHYEWGGMSRDVLPRELETYRALSNPDLSYIPRNVSDGILGREREALTAQLLQPPLVPHPCPAASSVPQPGPQPCSSVSANWLNLTSDS